MEEAIYLKRYKMKTRKWKEFRLAELFKVKRGKRLVESSRIPGMRPLVTAGFQNNGIASFIANSEQEIFPKSTITIDMFANAFYRNYPYSADDNVLVLINDDISENCKLFITSVFDNANQFSYGKQYRLGNFKRQKIMLPVTINDTPDWEFMEEYVQIKLNQIKDTYQLPSQHKITDFRELDEVEWGEFFVDDIINVKSGIRLTKNQQIDGRIPFIGASDNNNGITGFVNNINSSTGNNTLGVNYNGSIGYAFYHEYKATFSDDVKRLNFKSGDNNKYTLLFLKHVIERQAKKFVYGYKFNGQRMRRQIIKLPIEAPGKPDFIFMEQYMKRMENRVIEKVEQ